MTVPLFLLQVYDRVIPSRSFETLVSLLILAIAMISLMGALDFSRRRLLARFGARLQTQVEDAATLLKSRNTPNPIAREIEQLDGIRGFFNSSAATTTVDVLWVPVFIATVFALHPWFGYTAIVGLLAQLSIFGIGKVLSANRIREAKTAQENLGKVVGRLKRTKDVINVHRLSHSFQSNWKETRSIARVAAVRSKDRSSIFTLLRRNVQSIFSILIVFIGSVLVLDAQVTKGALIAGLVLLFRVFQPIGNLIGELDAITSAREKWIDLERAFDEKKHINAKTTTTTVPIGPLTLTDVTVTGDHKKTPLFENLNLTIDHSSITEIVGPCGSGKTLLALTIMGLRTPKNGIAKIGRIKLNNANAGTLTDRLGFMPQQQRFVAGTIAENISSFAYNPDIREIRKAAMAAYADEFIQALPNGYDTQIDDFGTRLAHGQRQLISFARAIYGDVQFLILDEPGEVLDNTMHTNLRRSIDNYSANGGSVIVFGRRPYRLNNCSARYLIKETSLMSLDTTPETLSNAQSHALVKSTS